MRELSVSEMQMVETAKDIRAEEYWNTKIGREDGYVSIQSLYSNILLP
jgi:uncharacterized protein YabN with tetrapyrrole methylase and pyrophosphatase domain